ncbi:MAG: EAL domain-containing protein [Neptuniibacter sp.]
MKGYDGSQPLQILFTLLSVILLSALAFFGFSIWQDIKSDEVDKLHQQNKALIEHSQNFFNQKTRLIVKTIDSSLLEKTEYVSETRQIFSYILSTTEEAAALALIDRDGNTLAVSGDISNTKPNYNQDVLDKAIITKTAQIGYQYKSGILGKSYLPLYVPILDENKIPAAIVAVFFYTQGKNSVMNNFITSDKNKIWLLGEQGKVRLTYPLPTGIVSNLFGWTLPPETALKIQHQLEHGKSHEGIQLSIENKDVLANVSYLAEYQLVVINAEPASDLTQIWLERMRPVGIAFLLFLLISLLAYRLSIRIGKKISAEKNKAEGNVKKLSRAIEQSPNSVVITDNNWHIEYANKNFEFSTDKPSARDEAPGKKIIDYMPYNLLKEDLEKISEAIQINGSWFNERQEEFEGKWYSFSISQIRTDEDEITHFVTVVQDITERKHAEVELHKQANFDPLTGLPNRRRAHEYLNAMLQDAWTSKQKVAVLYIDIDNFKNVNDTFGHQIGDQLLTLMANRLLGACRDVAQICHIGGDEFLVYFSYSDDQEVEHFALELLNEVSTPVMIEGKQIFISISLGVSKYPDDGNDVSSLIKYADIALYESKKNGRNRHSYFDQELNKRLKRRSSIESELRQAMHRHEISMRYQSKNDIKSKHIIGFEALMRWHNTVLGFVSPEEFIEVAEETGIIHELGEFALRQACYDLLEFQKKSDTPLRMAVNVSIQQLQDDKIIEILRTVLEETGVDPTYLELEITESLLAENINILLPRLEALLDQGVSLSIDDFGTGYSSLSYLTTFPVHTLKVDRAFVKDMETNQGDATLTRTIISMAHALGLKVVAEGIEDHMQLEMLNSFGCDIGQGYLFSKPLEKSEMELLVETFELPDITDFGRL